MPEGRSTPGSAAPEHPRFNTEVVFRARERHLALFGCDESGELVHIDDADSGRNGLTCLDCGGEIVGKKGPKRAHHFSHYTSIGGLGGPQSCQSAGETALHRISKELLEAYPVMQLPAGRVGPAWYAKKQIATLENVKLEQMMGTYRPDLSAEYVEQEPGANSEAALVRRRLDIEIYVTHRVGKAKQELVRVAGNPMVEIDLSKIRRDLTRRDLLALLRDGARRYWVYHPEMETAKLRAEELIAEEKRQREEARARYLAQRQEEELRRQETAATVTVAPAGQVSQPRPSVNLIRPGKLSNETRDVAVRDRIAWSAMGLGGLIDELGATARHTDVALRPLVGPIMLRYLAPWRDNGPAISAAGIPMDESLVHHLRGAAGKACSDGVIHLFDAYSLPIPAAQIATYHCLKERRLSGSARLAEIDLALRARLDVANGLIERAISLGKALADVTNGDQTLICSGVDKTPATCRSRWLHECAGRLRPRLTRDHGLHEIIGTALDELEKGIHSRMKDITGSRFTELMHTLGLEIRGPDGADLTIDFHRDLRLLDVREYMPKYDEFRSKMITMIGNNFAPWVESEEAGEILSGFRREKVGGLIDLAIQETAVTPISDETFYQSPVLSQAINLAYAMRAIDGLSGLAGCTPAQAGIARMDAAKAMQDSGALTQGNERAAVALAGRAVRIRDLHEDITLKTRSYAHRDQDPDDLAIRYLISAPTPRQGSLIYRFLRGDESGATRALQILKPGKTLTWLGRRPD